MVNKIVPLVKDFLIGFIVGCLEELLPKDDTCATSRTEEETPKASELPYYKFEPSDRDQAAGALARKEFET